MHISWLQLINYNSIFFHDTTWMLDVPRVGKRRKNPTKSSVLLLDEISALVDIPTRMRGSNVYFFTLEEERSMQDRASADQQLMHRESTNPTYRSSKMYSCGSCFLWSCFSSQNYRWSSCKTEVRLGVVRWSWPYKWDRS